jgi:hypothetical protein
MIVLDTKVLSELMQVQADDLGWRMLLSDIEAPLGLQVVSPEG